MNEEKQVNEVMRKLGLGDDVPILDASAEDFKEQ